MPVVTTGGSAFPVPPVNLTHDGGIARPTPGMSLRDWFAGQALQGLMACPEVMGEGPHDYAVLAYKYADAMLATR